MINPYHRKINVENYSVLRFVPKKVTKNYAKVILKYARNGSILELGFGTGELLKNLAELSRGRNLIFGVDKSKNMFFYTRKILKEMGIAYQNVILHRGTLNSLIKKFKIKFNVIHFKALLHCISNPEKEMDLMSDFLLNGGYIITGHEISYIEDRIEQLFKYKKIEDREVEDIFKFYFKLREKIGKPFIKRKYPAGDSRNAAFYFIKNKKFNLVK